MKGVLAAAAGAAIPALRSRTEALRDLAASARTLTRREEPERWRAALPARPSTREAAADTASSVSARKVGAAEAKLAAWLAAVEAAEAGSTGAEAEEGPLTPKLRGSPFMPATA